jgi:hypothetical protein
MHISVTNQRITRINVTPDKLYLIRYRQEVDLAMDIQKLA